jgi:hypothetical protein
MANDGVDEITDDIIEMVTQREVIEEEQQEQEKSHPTFGRAQDD